jgi:hypothetical protein
MEHLVKTTNVFKSNVTWFVTLCIYLLLIHSLISLTNYLPTYYPPTYLHITNLPTHPLTYLSLTIRFIQSLAIKFCLSLTI